MNIKSCKLSRKVGVDLGLKSLARPIDSKCKLTTPPGMHGAKRGRASDYGLQLKAKQTIRYTYGVLEKAFRRYYDKATKKKGVTGEVLLQLLECRLDNVAYRMGFASTRREAKQIISHKNILVNGQIVNIPSYAVKVGDVIEVREKAKQQVRILNAVKMQEAAGFSDWVSVDVSKLVGEFKRVPDRSDLPSDLNEQLVVELYSK